ncbi:hypothetical protein KBA63_04005 [Candidatus Woesebacteria bacterium]|nr:hypothetical protein [Candidatus Woesebacteria bacterium]
MESTPNLCCLLISCDIFVRGSVAGKVSLVVDNFEVSGTPLEDFQSAKEIAYSHVNTLPEYKNPIVHINNIINLSQVFK